MLRYNLSDTICQISCIRYRLSNIICSDIVIDAAARCVCRCGHLPCTGNRCRSGSTPRDDVNREQTNNKLQISGQHKPSGDICFLVNKPREKSPLAYFPSPGREDRSSRRKVNIGLQLCRRLNESIELSVLTVQPCCRPAEDRRLSITNTKNCRGEGKYFPSSTTRPGPARPVLPAQTPP